MQCFASSLHIFKLRLACICLDDLLREQACNDPVGLVPSLSFYTFHVYIVLH